MQRLCAIEDGDNEYPPLYRVNPKYLRTKKKNYSSDMFTYNSLLLKRKRIRDNSQYPHSHWT